MVGVNAIVVKPRWSPNRKTLDEIGQGKTALPKLPVWTPTPSP